jgi:hypothetical protein
MSSSDHEGGDKCDERCAESCPKRPKIVPDQPAPTPGLGDVWGSIISDAKAGPYASLVPLMEERRAIGIARYGTPLQRDNGRDHEVDAAQEMLDAAAYLYAADRTGLAVDALDLLLILRHEPNPRFEREDVWRRKQENSAELLRSANAEAARLRAELDSITNQRDDCREQVAVSERHRKDAIAERDEAVAKLSAVVRQTGEVITGTPSDQDHARRQRETVTILLDGLEAEAGKADREGDVAMVRAIRTALGLGT